MQDINTVTIGKEVRLTVQSDVMIRQDDGAVCPQRPCHDAVDLPILTVYVLLLKQIQITIHTFRSYRHGAGLCLSVAEDTNP